MTRSRGVLLILLLSGALWAIGLAQWQAGTGGDTLGPAGVAELTRPESSQASPIATACVAIMAVTGLLAAMLGRIGRFVVLGVAALAAIGYGITAATAMSAPGATSWPILALTAAACSLVVIVWVGLSSAAWTNSNRYARSAEPSGEEFDATAAWDALSRGDEPDPEAPEDEDPEDGADEDRGSR